VVLRQAPNGDRQVRSDRSAAWSIDKTGKIGDLVAEGAADPLKPTCIAE
jgi:hypothetical protein